MPKGIITQADFDALPSDDWRKEYKKGEGDFYYLTVPTQEIEIDGEKRTFEFANTGGLRASLENERAAHSRLKGATKSLLDDDGKPVVDIEKYNSTLSENEKLKKGATPDEKLKAQWEAKETALIEEYDGKLKTETEAREKMRTQLETHIIDGAISKALGAREKGAGNPVVLIPHMRSHYKIHENDDGTLTTRIIDPESKVERITTKAGGGTNPMDDAELVEEFANNPVFAPNFAGSGINGTGGDGGRGGQSGEDLPTDPIERLALVHDGKVK